ncbi:MAG: hypothetical protein GQ574_08590 [Crocinitomix sp.]|nr:hypothetical protein [Crocinitomix sp.]
MVKQFLYISLVVLTLVSCNKETEPEGPILPVGAVAFGEGDIAFVPYGASDQVFKKAPDFTTELILNFKERLFTEQVFAWNQTFFTFNVDPGLELELRLRYLQAEEEYHKSLAIYMPYRDVFGNAKTSVFETPLDTTVLESGFFTDLVTFHDTLEINGADWFDVFEINPLTSTNPEADSETNFSKVYYNPTFGIIEMDQKNGDVWILHP